MRAAPPPCDPESVEARRASRRQTWLEAGEPREPRDPAWEAPEEPVPLPEGWNTLPPELEHRECFDGDYRDEIPDWLQEGLVTLEGRREYDSRFPELPTVGLDGDLPAQAYWLTLYLRQIEELASSGSYLLGASTCRAPDGGGDTHSTRGIVHGHAYALLEVVSTHPEGERLLKLRNPWGRTEWEGRWGDADMARPENARMRAKLGWKKEDDGIFWIGWQDFVQYFTSISICMLPANWHCASAQGEWAGATAGGCPNFDSTAGSC